MPEHDQDTMALQGTALRYAARDLSPGAAAAFEARLAGDQDAREALAEAVRLSAAALGQAPPEPDRSFRALIRERLRLLAAYGPRWARRRAYRGHPLAWLGLGAGVVAAATLIALRLASPETAGPSVAAARTVAPLVLAGSDPSRAPLPRAVAPGEAGTAGLPAARLPSASALKAAEIWAELSTPDHVEKDHDDEVRLRHRLRDLHILHPTKPAPTSAVICVE